MKDEKALLSYALSKQLDTLSITSDCGDINVLTVEDVNEVKSLLKERLTLRLNSLQVPTEKEKFKSWLSSVASEAQWQIKELPHDHEEALNLSKLSDRCARLSVISRPRDNIDRIILDDYEKNKDGQQLSFFNQEDSKALNKIVKRYASLFEKQ